MTIASEITRINNNIANAYTACSSKGATMPSTQNSANLATCINSISSGGGGGSDIGIKREVSSGGVYQVPTSSFTFSLPSNAKNVGNYAMYYAFYNCTGLTSVDLSSLTTVSGNYAMQNAFSGCTGLTSVDLSNLVNAGGTESLSYAFQDCTGLTSVDLSSLYLVHGSEILRSAFEYCTKLENISFPNLKFIGLELSSTNDHSHFSRCFAKCTKLTSITFPNLEKIYCTGSATSNGTFYGNNKIKKLYFPKLNTITYGTNATTTYQNACKYIFSGCSSLTELHFSAASQSAIEASTGYSTAWGRGAGNVTIYFDL